MSSTTPRERPPAENRTPQTRALVVIMPTTDVPPRVEDAIRYLCERYGIQVSPAARPQPKEGGTVDRALAHITALPRLRTPVVSRGCVIVHTWAATNLYFKDAGSVEHASSQVLLNAMGRTAFVSFVEHIEEIMEDLRDGVTDRTVLVTVDRRTDRVSEWWVGRRHDWSGRHGLRARLLAEPTAAQPAAG